MAVVTNLDFEQVIQGAYDEAQQALRTTSASGSQSITGAVSIIGQPIAVSGSLEITSLNVIGSVEVINTSIDGPGGNYFTITSGLASPVKKMVVYDTTGEVLNIATGASGSEVVKTILGPGCDQTFEIAIPASTRISVRGAHVAPTAGGSLIVNFEG